MPLGSSSDAPVMSPGPKTSRNVGHFACLTPATDGAFIANPLRPESIASTQHRSPGGLSPEAASRRLLGSVGWGVTWLDGFANGSNPERTVVQRWVSKSPRGRRDVRPLLPDSRLLLGVARLFNTRS